MENHPHRLGCACAGHRGLRQHGSTVSAAWWPFRPERSCASDLTALVTASGEIKPKNYINIGANAIGMLTKILVKEGDHVKKGQLVARVENIQPEAQVASQTSPGQFGGSGFQCGRSRLEGRRTKTCAPSRP